MNLYIILIIKQYANAFIPLMVPNSCNKVANALAKLIVVNDSIKVWME